MPQFKRLYPVVLSLLLACSQQLQAQVGKAVSRMQEGKWPSAEQILRKEIAKDSLDIEARLLLAQYFFSSDNPQHNLDSATAQVANTQRMYASLPDRQVERLMRVGIDSLAIDLLRREIDSAAFDDAKRVNSVEAYEQFIAKYPNAEQAVLAHELRNEVAFLEALKLNTAQAFGTFLQKYPDSRRTEEVRERYDRLNFEETTRDGKLASYRKFVTSFPLSAYRGEAERKIFDVSTAAGLPQNYRQFLTEYPQSAYDVRARNILYYLVEPEERTKLHSDSLAALADLNKGYWVPFFKNGSYGFMDDDGNERMAPRFTKIDSTYLCGNIREDVLLTSDGLFSRTGHRLFGKNPLRVVSMGQGFILVETEGCKTVVHKSGFVVGPDCAANARIVSDQYVAIQTGEKWQMYSFNGLHLKLQSYEDIRYEDDIIILTRLGKRLLVRAADVARVADGVQLSDSLVFDEVRAWGDGNLVVRNGALEGVLNQDLGFIIPLDRQTLRKTTSGFVRSKDGRQSVVGAVAAIESETFDNIIDYGDWMVLARDKKSSLYRVSTRTIAGQALDSVWLRSKIPFGTRNDSLFVFGLSGRTAVFDSKSPPSFIKSRDTVVYYWVADKKTKNVFEATSNRKMFTLEFEDIEGIGEGRFIVRQKNKKGQVKLGMVGPDGKLLLPAEYDVIVPSGNYLSLLKEKQFGLYHIEKRKLIHAGYERNVVPYSAKYFVAFKGAYGIINENEEPVTGFEFDEIRYWNDTSAWVKKNHSWSVYSIKGKTTKLGRIRDFEYLLDTEQEKIVRIQQDNHFGVISNRRGVIIPATFSDVINVGSAEKPFYFTDKRVQEAEIDVVIYYDHTGRLIRKLVYESDEYDKIYCDED
jgi:outer membrane protein assembly factor BamD (BamD/ComL family)